MSGFWERSEIDLNRGLAVSLAVHVLLVILLPGLRREVPISRIIEVDILPAPMQPAKPVTPPTISGGAAKPLPQKDAWQWKPLPSGIISDNAGKISRQETVPMADLPGRVSSGPDAIHVPDASPLPLKEIGTVGPHRSSTALEGPIAAADITNTAPTGGQSADGAAASGLIFDWAGPPRKLLYQPPKPRYSSAVEGEVGVKIWVDRAGHVANAMVTRKLDAALEQLALDYIKKCRFEPLQGREEKMQSGVARFFFRLE